MVVTHNFKDLLEIASKCQAFNLPTLKENPLEIDYEDLKENLKVVMEPPMPFAASEGYKVNICQFRRLTAMDGDTKAIYEVTFDTKDCNFSFNPGDTIGIIPHNSEEDVDFVIDHLNIREQADLLYNLSCNTNVKGAKIPLHIPVRSTLRHVLQNCVDLRSIVKKLFLLALSRYTKDDNERKVLEYMSSKEGSTAYNTHILNQGICILDMFHKFKSCQPPIQILLSNLPRLLPRPYSIVNSNKKDRNIIKICFSVMYLQNNRKGLTTGWLEKLISSVDSIERKFENLNINENKIVNIYLRKNVSGFSFSADMKTSNILIGPGTGVSPYIGFLEEKQHLKEQGEINLSDTWLFFGCRNPKLDFIYEDEIKQFLNNGCLSKLSVSYSRIESDTKYVQDAILQNGKDVIEYINSGASIFICGDVKIIAPLVKESLIKCLVKYDGKTTEEAEIVLSNMQTGKRYFVDVWN